MAEMSEQMEMTVTQATPLRVIADGADTDSAAARATGLVVAVDDRVQATLRTPRMPLVTEKVEEPA